MNDSNDIKQTQQQPIDFANIARQLWAKRMTFAKVLPIVLVGTYLLICCIPRYYTCKMELCPESDNALPSGGSLSSIASSMGLSLGNLSLGSDAISPELYPDLLKSNNFLVTLFPVTVTTKDGLTTNYYEYLKDYQDAPFWQKYFIQPIIEWLKPTAASGFKGTDSVDVRHMTKQQQEIAMLISNNIKCTVNKKTGAVSISITDQDPEVCALIGDSAVQRMQDFIVNYRTKKARNDYEYYSKLRDEAKEKYDKARRAYATYYDTNTDATLQSVRSKIEDLENAMQLRYNIYSNLSTQAQISQNKIQENTPAFTALSTATVPYKPAGPKRTFYALIVTILVAFGMSIRILTKSKKN